MESVHCPRVQGDWMGVSSEMEVGQPAALRPLEKWGRPRRKGTEASWHKVAALYSQRARADRSGPKSCLCLWRSIQTTTVSPREWGLPLRLNEMWALNRFQQRRWATFSMSSFPPPYPAQSLVPRLPPHCVVCSPVPLLFLSLFLSSPSILCPSATMLSNEPYPEHSLCHVSTIQQPKPWQSFHWCGCAVISLMDPTTGHCLCVLGCDLQTRPDGMAARPLQTEHDGPEAQRSILRNWEVWPFFINQMILCNQSPIIIRHSFKFFT